MPTEDMPTEDLPTEHAADGRGSLFDPIFGATGVAALVSDQAWVTAMLDVEAALARAAATHGVIGDEDARSITAVASALGKPGGIDIAELGEASAAGGNPVIPLVSIIRRAAAAQGVPSKAVHSGATSQDIMDTALMLMTRAAGAQIVESLETAALAARALASAHRSTPMAARTLGQQALPTTFGLAAATWSLGLSRAAARIAALHYPVQFGGAAGTLAALHPHGIAVSDSLADELGLDRSIAPWHTERTPLAEIVGVLGTAAGAVSKCATDIVAMAATELGEVSEDAPGGSSAMPHKRNPVAAITARGAARRVPGLVATALSSMDHEYQRAAGAWHAEWETVTDLIRLTGGAAQRLSDSLSGLHVHQDALARNLDATGGLLLAERVTSALSKHTDTARAIVTAACLSGAPLDEDPAIVKFLDPGTVRALLDPSDYLGHAGDLVDRVLAQIPSPGGPR